jgi:trehalose utilization protein
VRQINPDGIHEAIAAHLRRQDDMTVHTATLEQPEHALTEAELAETDVQLWRGHLAHDQVQDAIVYRVQQRVLKGMGLIVLHSAHHSKIFRRLMGTTCGLTWREADE